MESRGSSEAERAEEAARRAEEAARRAEEAAEDVRRGADRDSGKDESRVERDQEEMDIKREHGGGGGGELS